MKGIDLPKEEVVALVGKWSDDLPEVRSFSKLTDADFEALCKGVHTININDRLLKEQIPDELLPCEFIPVLEITRRVCSRRTEMGARNVINLFLNFAVYMARMVFAEERLVVHHDVQTDILDVPEVGLVHGPFDFLTARAYGDIPMGTYLNILLLICDRYTHARPGRPTCLQGTTIYGCCGGEKDFRIRWSELKGPASRPNSSSSNSAIRLPYQSFANNSCDDTRTGAITDGLKWSIYHRYKTGWYFAEILARGEEATLKLLRITPHSKL
jgi:hypothetical protein